MSNPFREAGWNVDDDEFKRTRTEQEASAKKEAERRTDEEKAAHKAKPFYV